MLFARGLISYETIPPIDQTVVLFNIGKLQSDELEGKIDSLLITNPKKIGVNLCHFDKPSNKLIKKYKSDDRVVFANCEEFGSLHLSQIIGDGNTVTHFRTDNPDYFELQITGFKGRGNSEERINYGARLDYLANSIELANSYSWFNPEYLNDKTILLGYMGDYLTDSIYYYQNCRITPLNLYFGEANTLPDMYDIEVSANILRTINDNAFINELNKVLRVTIILFISILNVIILTYVKTKWIFVNLIIATILFVLLTGTSSFLLVYSFDEGYFLEMDELPIILLVTTIFTVILNSRERISAQ